MKRKRFTQETARQFDRYSVANVATVVNALECGCRPYEDIFTYKRWQAQGFVVKKGEKGIRIPVIVESQSKDDDGKTKISKAFKNSAVFCRHQVKPLARTVA